jgi:hypothetical protein
MLEKGEKRVLPTMGAQLKYRNQEFSQRINRIAAIKFGRYLSLRNAVLPICFYLNCMENGNDDSSPEAYLGTSKNQ